MPQLIWLKMTFSETQLGSDVGVALGLSGSLKVNGDHKGAAFVVGSRLVRGSKFIAYMVVEFIVRFVVVLVVPVVATQATELPMVPVGLVSSWLSLGEAQLTPDQAPEGAGPRSTVVGVVLATGLKVTPRSAVSAPLPPRLPTPTPIAQVISPSE